jgi:hypothetical protein
MIGPRAGTRVWLAAGVTDMRCGIDSLAVKVAEAVGRYVLKANKIHGDDTPIRSLGGKGKMALAIGYSLSNWTALTNFVGDGRIDAHNNTAERALRDVAIGRKNYVHVGSDAGGITAAVSYTLPGTAKRNGINPQRYLRYVLDRIADHPSNRIDELLPWAVAAKWEDEASAKDMPLAA